jgi:hypothetical protein
MLAMTFGARAEDVLNHFSLSCVHLYPSAWAAYWEFADHNQEGGSVAILKMYIYLGYHAPSHNN